MFTVSSPLSDFTLSTFNSTFFPNCGSPIPNGVKYLPPDHPNRGRFRFALANPPYYGEGRIADLFAEIAAASLAPDGVCWMVAKTPDIIRAACEKCFSKVETLKRRGYTVLKASVASR